MSKQTSSVSSPKGDLIDLSHYWGVLRQYKWNILALAAVITTLALLVTFFMTRTYRATTTVLIKSEQAKVVSIEDVYSLNTAGKEYFLTQFEILKSRDLAERVVKRLDLVNHPLFDPRQLTEGFNFRSLLGGGDPSPSTDEEIFQSVVETFTRHVTVSPVRNTQVVKLSFEAADPKLAAVVANTIASEYINRYMEDKLSGTAEAVGWLTQRLDVLRVTVQSSEQRLQEYRDAAGLVDMRGVQTLGADELEELSRRYGEVQKKRSEVETLHRQIQAFGASPSTDQLLTIPSILSNALIRSSKEEHSRAERKVVELSNRYGPKHPKMIAAQTDLGQTAENLSFQALRVSQSIASEYSGALQTEKTLEAQISEAKTQLQQVNRKEFKLRELESEVQANRQLYDMFLNRAKETSEAESIQAPHAKVIDVAVVPKSPVKPNKKRIVLLAAFLSTLLGILLAFLLDSLNRTIRTPEDVEEKLGLPMLGFLPLDTTNKSSLPFEGFKAKSRGAFAEAVRSIRTSLVLSGIDKPQKVILITSSVPAEGKSTVSLNLARALGQMEKVLLIDADMRRPTLSRALDLPVGTPGLSGWVAGTADTGEVILKMDGWELDVMPSGVVPHNPLELIGSKSFTDALAKLKPHYDRIIIDSSPVCAVSDALMLSSHADALVFVVQADATADHVAAQCVNRLQDVKAPLLGAILNRVNPNKAGSSYAGYYQDYGYGSDDGLQEQQAFQNVKGNKPKKAKSRTTELTDS